jgi:hypothetical protein
MSNYPPSQMNPCVSADGPRYQADDDGALERSYIKMLDEFANGKASQWIDEAALQIADAVCREMALQLKANPKMFDIGSDNAAFIKIGLVAAKAADAALNDTAKVWV